MEAQTRNLACGLSVSLFVLGTAASAFVLSAVQPPAGLAAPTQLCFSEIKAVAALFLISLVVFEPAKEALGRRAPALSRLMRRQSRLPSAAKVGAAILVVLGCFVFAFWSATDVLGGYYGYGYSFAHHPVLQLIYSNFVGVLPLTSSLDKGTQASLFLFVACTGLVALRINKGLGNALKDTITLFAAPLFVVFELALWYYAPQDMTWHVTDFLWMGGVADGGWRSLDNGGSYIFSNWLVLFVAALLVASRTPKLALLSRVLWTRRSALE